VETAYLSLGSNLGDRQKFIYSAVGLIENFCKISQLSSLYQTPPWGKTNQPLFLNACLSIQTNLSPTMLLDRLKNIESTLGREPTEKWGPREIDIDILFYDQRQIKQENLIIPHPVLQDRAFVLVPLAEIAPDLIHPILKKSISELTKNIDKTGVKVYEP